MPLLIWVGLACLVGAYAGSKNTSGGFWGGFWASIFLSPLGGIIVVTVLKPDEARLLRQGMKKCPDCAELIKAEAQVCKHCHKHFESVGAPLSPTPTSRVGGISYAGPTSQVEPYAKKKRGDTWW